MITIEVEDLILSATPEKELKNRRIDHLCVNQMTTVRKNPSARPIRIKEAF